MNKKIFFVGLLVVISIPLLVYLFASTSKPDIKNNGEAKLATSIFPLTSLTEQIVGDKLEIVQILPTGSSPHTFEPKISNIEKLTDVDVVFSIGMGVDRWAEAIASSNDIKIVNFADSVNLIEGVAHKDQEEEEHEEEEEALDPHYWLSVENAIIIANEIYNQVIELDPANKEFYTTNLNHLINDLNDLKQEYQNKFNSDIEIITFHEAFGYMADEMGFEVLTTIEPFPGKEPTPAYLAEVGDIIEEYDVKVLFKEPQLSNSIIQPLAEDYNINILTLDPIGGTESIETYQDLIRYNLDTILSTLN